MKVFTVALLLALCLSAPCNFLSAQAAPYYSSAQTATTSFCAQTAPDDISAASSPETLAAQTDDGRRYARADSRNVYFCTEEDQNTALFAVPYTYCVEIIADRGEWYLVRYAADDGLYRALTGYCRKKNLTPVEAPSGELYLNYPVTTTLRSDVPQDGSLPGLEIQVTAAYYGVYYKGAAAYSYVLYDGQFRYISGANEDYPLNEIPAEPTFGESAGPANDNTRLITAVVICVLAATVVVALVFAGKSRPHTTKHK